MNAIATRWASAEETMRRLAMTVLGALAVAAALIFAAPAHAQNAQAQPSPYGLEEVVAAGHGFFGSTSGAIATAIERAFSMYGLPNGYILGQEAGGAFVGGLTYGEGTLYTKNAGDHSVFWQGPSLGWDFGGEGARTMMLVYHLPSVDNLQGRYGGVAGSASRRRWHARAQAQQCAAGACAHRCRRPARRVCGLSEADQPTDLEPVLTARP
jgi:hypothetical protein